jgi:glycosyltransferase involved in cell wall biosynthesis
MKILYWTDLFFPHIGGIETFSSDLIPALQTKGHEIKLLTSRHIPNLPDVERIGSITVHRFDIWGAIKTNDLKKLMSVRRAVTELKREFNPDLTHLHFGATSYMHVQTQSAVCVPTLTTVHALPESSLTEDSLLKKVVHASRAVNAVSAKGHGLLRNAFPDAADRLSHVYYGLAPSADAGVEVAPPSFDEPVFLCLGRLAAQKGFDVALKAFARVGKVIPRARLMIVGEGVEETALKQLSATLCIGERVDFTGSVPPQAVYEVINKATIVLLPSRFEGLPLVALQAAKMQRPIVSSNVDGLPELVTDQESGVVLKENNELELANAIIALMRDPQKAIAMGKAAARRFEAHFGFDHCVDQYEGLYRRVASPT